MISQTKKIRDTYIDFIKGIAILGIIFIHTSGWSGATYGTPEYIHNFAHLFDIPIFFVMTGCVLSQINKKWFLLKQFVKLSFSFTLIVVLSQILFRDFNLVRIIKSILVIDANIPQFKVFSASYWFVPVYIHSLFFALLIIRFISRFIVPYLILALIYYSFVYIYQPKISDFLSYMNLLIFYTGLILMGYHYYLDAHNKKFIFLLVFSLLVTLLFGINSGNFPIQQNKYPLTLIYVIASQISISLIFLLKPFYIKIEKDRFSKSLSYFGKNSLYLYISQGISSSLLYDIVPAINLNWSVKLIISFFLNIIITVSLGIIIKNILYFSENSFHRASANI